MADLFTSAAKQNPGFGTKVTKSKVVGKKMGKKVVAGKVKSGHGATKKNASKSGSKVMKSGMKRGRGY